MAGSSSRSNPFDWRSHEKELDRILLKDLKLFPEGSKEYHGFWPFFYRYQKFQSKNESEKASTKGEDSDKSKSSGKFGLPTRYDKSYRINFVIKPPLRDTTKGKDSKPGDGLSNSKLVEFTAVVRHYMNFLQKQKFDHLVRIRNSQKGLPIWQHKKEILEMIKTNQVVIVAGDTGCGKSTQVPQYLLSAGMSSIACTQPRRIACISLAKRVGYETLNEYGSDIAYQVRFESSRTGGTKVVFLTEGLLLRQLGSNQLLSQYEMIVVDEVHERHIHTDFLLGILKHLLHARKDLKLVLMSATINIQLFSSYFDDAPVVQVPGRLFPIEVEYVPVVNPLLKGTSSKPEKMDPLPYIQIMERIDHKYPATERGDLLVFVSGMKEISLLVEKAKEYAQLTRRWIILPLHSALSIEEQDRVFDLPPDGVRKCIISTNIAETSITIDGVRFIVDSGKVKEMGYDPQAKMRRLQEFWISKASAEQRKGRAGRTGPGVCFRMYSESDYEAFPSYSTPEIQRVPLDSLILQTVALGLGNPRKFPFLESPSLSNIENSSSFLKEQGALTSEEQLTMIGRMLAQLPVDVVMGKMLIMGTIFNVIDVVLVIAAGLSVQSPFHRAAMREEQARLARRPLESDHGDPFTLLNAFDEWIQVKSSSGSHNSLRWCKRHGLEQQRLYEMTKLQQQFQEILQDANLISREQDYTRVDGHRKGSSRERRKELKEIRKRKYGSQHKRKMLKMDGEGGVVSDEEEPSGDSQDLRDMEFKLTHDLSQLQEATNTRRHFTRKDINLLKVVLCRYSIPYITISGLYPQLAVPDECNSWRRDSEQVYHTKAKQYVLLHPSSVFSSNPELLEQHVTKGEPTDGVELLAYVDLLETDKPYLVNVLRTPALPTLTLFGSSLDTNSDCSRIVVDGWLELQFQNDTAGVRALAAVQKLRATMSDLLKTKLELHNVFRSCDSDEEESQEALFSKQRQVNQLTSALSDKLSEFLSSSFPYSLKRVPSTHVTNLYKGPTENAEQTHNSISLLLQEGDVKGNNRKVVQHPIKGGYMITDYLTYDCLIDSVTVASQSSTPYLQNVWCCPDCNETFVFSLADRLHHQSTCSMTTKKSNQGSSASFVHREPYFCRVCCSHFHFTKPELLRHKQGHKS